MIAAKGKTKTEPTIQTLQLAPTLKVLRDRIDEAIEIAGEDATWNGFDDEAIYIYHPTDSSNWIAIFPDDRKLPGIARLAFFVSETPPLKRCIGENHDHP